MKVILYNTKSNSNPLPVIIAGLFSDEHLISHYHRAIARFFKLGVVGALSWVPKAQALSGGVWGYPPPKNFQIWRPQNAIFYPRILLATRLVTGCAITGTLCKLEWILQIVHIHVNFNRGFCFLLLTIFTHRGPNNISAIKMANNCKSLQSK